MKRRNCDALGNTVGDKHSNPILDTRIYKLEFPYGRFDEYSVNIIIEDLIDQFDDQGWYTGVL